MGDLTAGHFMPGVVEEFVWHNFTQLNTTCHISCIGTIGLDTKVYDEALMKTHK